MVQAVHGSNHEDKGTSFVPCLPTSIKDIITTYFPTEIYYLLAYLLFQCMAGLLQMFCCYLFKATCFVHCQFLNGTAHLIRSNNHTIIPRSITNIKFITLNSEKYPYSVFSTVWQYFRMQQSHKYWMARASLLIENLNIFPDFINITLLKLLAMEFALMACSILLIKHTAYLNITIAYCFWSMPIFSDKKQFFYYLNNFII